MRLGIIGGTNADISIEWVDDARIETPYGAVEVSEGRAEGSAMPVVFLRRHGRGHERLSSMVEHRANVWALKEAGCSAIVGTTVCGVVDPELDLARPIVFDDLLFTDNRLPDGSPCTFFTTPAGPGRGHFIFDSPFSPALRSALLAACERTGAPAREGGTYAYCLGPRFNSRAEIALLASVGATAVSQTAGPEAVLAGELGIPYALLGFGVDYANGVTAEPTPVEVLDANIARGREVVGAAVAAFASAFEPAPFDTGFVYRFE